MMKRVLLPVALTVLLSAGCGDDDLGFGGFGGAASSTSTATGTASNGPTNVASSTVSSSSAEGASSTDASVSASDASSTSSGPTACGDGMVGAGETCDDGNAAPGDCCDAACQAEPGCETEVNDTDPVADDFAAHALGDVVEGNIAPVGDVDVYAFTVPVGPDQVVVLETGPGPLGTACATMTTMFGVDTEITLFDAAGAEIEADDDGSPAGFCSRIDAVLTPGDYRVAVAASATAGMLNSSFGYGLTLTMSDFVPPVCGDGHVDPGEVCDDGNTLPGDGCSPTCTEECPGVGEIEPNDTSATASGPVAEGLLNCGAITPAADVDFFSFTLTGASTSIEIETFDATGTGCNTIDTVIALWGPNGSTEIAEDDDLGINRCSFISADVARNLPPGTYYVRVNEYGDNGTIGGYRVRMTIDSTCGDGIPEGAEECDGGPGCDAQCNRVPMCGDGFIDAGESCEDGNTVSGDGCSATCQIEGLVTEVESNDSRAAADASPVQITGDTVIAGSITEGSDEVDIFRVTLAAPATVRFETFVGLGDCDTTSSMVLRLRDATFAQRYVDTENKGIDGCSALVVSLPAGVYYISVEETGTNASLPSYYLQVALQTQAGVEAEPAGTNGANDTFATAEHQLGAQTDVFVLGDHTFGAPDGALGVGDRDFYAITVPDGASIRAEIIEGNDDPNKSCDSNNLDSALTLFAPDGTTVLSTDDDDGRGFCSLLDGTGSSGFINSASHDLPAGTYFLEVRESDTESMSQPDDIFTYRLVVTVRTP